jgi:hypothetical protein
MTEILPLNHGNLLYVAKRMRQIDREEIFATRWSDSAEALAAEAMMLPIDMCFIAASNGEPVAAFGAFPMHPGCWSVWMFATDKWASVALSTTRFIKNKLIVALKKSGANRAECRSHINHKTAHKWLDSLGAIQEATLEKFGKDRQDFYLFKWNNDQHQHPTEIK